MPKPPLHSIRVAAQRSGLGIERIRAWERRYQVVEPIRSGNRHRLYRDTDIERLRLLARTVQAGRRIGDIAQLSNARLTIMVDEDERTAGLGSALDSSRPRTDRVMEYFDPCVRAIETLDPKSLAQTLNEAEDNLIEPFMLEDLITPLIQHMQDECRQGTLRMSQKRMAEGIIRSHLMGYTVRPGTEPTFRIVVAGGPADTDDFPSLKLAVAARAYGWQPICLGLDLAADEITYAVKHGKALCTAIAAHPVGDPLLPNELRKLRLALPENHPIFLYGSELGLFDTVIADAQVIPVRTFGELRLALERMRQTPLPEAQ